MHLRHLSIKGHLTHKDHKKPLTVCRVTWSCFQISFPKGKAFWKKPRKPKCAAISFKSISNQEWNFFRVVQIAKITSSKQIPSRQTKKSPLAQGPNSNKNHCSYSVLSTWTHILTIICWQIATPTKGGLPLSERFGLLMKIIQSAPEGKS